MLSTKTTLVHIGLLQHVKYKYKGKGCSKDHNAPKKKYLVQAQDTRWISKGTHLKLGKQPINQRRGGEGKVLFF